MSSSPIEQILEKARDLAMEGDYQSSLAHYQEVKESIESKGLKFESPSAKRVCS